MADSTDLPAWIALFAGLYALAAGFGEMRRPGMWASMPPELARNAPFRFVAGVVTLSVGAAIYLASPWRPGDWLAILVSVIGGLMVVEGLLFLAAPDLFARWATKGLKSAERLWPILALLLGVALILAALIRLQTI